MIFGLRRGFSRSRRGVQLRLDADEALVLGEMLRQLGELVGTAEPAAGDDPLAGMFGSDDADRPEDPAELRLFPDGYLDDPDAAGEFRRYTQGPLRAEKSQRLQTSLAVLPRFDADSTKARPVDLSDDETTGFLLTLNDLRLVLGVRLGIVTDDQDVADEWPADDPRRATYGAYQWLTWLQASLLDAISGSKE